MKNLSFCLLMLVASLFHCDLFAQSKLSIENVVSVYLRNSGPIMAQEEIKGYFLFYQSDKIDKRTNEYTLQILDDNLNKVKDIKFTDSRTINLLESSYNGSEILFMFYDSDQKMLDYRVYGADGKQKFNYTRPIDRKTRNYIDGYAMYDNEEAQNKNLFSIENKGFVTCIPVREGKQYTYEISFYQSDKKKSWTYVPADPERIASPTYLGSSDSVAVFEVVKRARLMSNKHESWLMGVYLQNGKKAFEFETNQEKFNFFPMGITTVANSSEFLLMGPYFDKDDKVMKDKSLGLGVWIMNNQGKVVNSKYNSWAEDISKHLKVNAKGRVDELGYIYFHRILQTSDGNIFAIGEGYKKQASALGIGAAVLTGALGGRSNMSTTKMKITDILMLQFNNKFDLTKAEIFDKNSNNIELLSGSEFVSAPVLATHIKYFYDGFDYTFSQTDKAHSLFTVGYTDYVRSKDYKGLTFNTISYYNNSITTDKIELKTNSSRMRIMPAKTGSVMILEYFKKAKRLDMRLEKVN
jgi:hypothetical protein